MAAPFACHVSMRARSVLLLVLAALMMLAGRAHILWAILSMLVGL